MVRLLNLSEILVGSCNICQGGVVHLAPIFLKICKRLLEVFNCFGVIFQGTVTFAKSIERICVDSFTNVMF